MNRRGAWPRDLKSAAVVLLLAMTVRVMAQAPSQPAAVEAIVPPHAVPTTQAAGEGIIHRAQPLAGAPTRAAPAKLSAAPDAGYFLQLTCGLGLVVGLIFLLRWLGRRFFALPGDARSSKAVQVLCRSVIAPRQQVLLLGVGRRVVVVAHCGTQMNTLCQITAPQEVADLIAQVRSDRAPPISKAFGSMFSRTKDKFAQVLPDLPADSEPDAATVDPAMGTTQHELDGLMDQVRGMSRRFRPPPADPQ